jgi:hypothetical protein
VAKGGQRSCSEVDRRDQVHVTGALRELAGELLAQDAKVGVYVS